MADPESFVTNGLTGNADVDWNTFDSADYFEHNYRTLLHEDAEIIKIVADFFQDVAPESRRCRAIDVGAGVNLYPALTMLPFASEIVLYERALTNREWLDDQLRTPAPSWQRFWDSIREDRSEYRRIGEPLKTLGRTATIVDGDLFELSPGQYDIGTMFFVAESVTNRIDEFQRAIQLFLGSLVERAPFAMTFMRQSSGYSVGGRQFPACSVTEGDVERCLVMVADIAEIRVIESNGLRGGYSGMIVACGSRK